MTYDGTAHRRRWNDERSLRIATEEMIQRGKRVMTDAEFVAAMSSAPMFRDIPSPARPVSQKDGE